MLDLQWIKRYLLARPKCQFSQGTKLLRGPVGSVSAAERGSGVKEGKIWIWISGTQIWVWVKTFGPNIWGDEHPFTGKLGLTKLPGFLTHSHLFLISSVCVFSALMLVHVHAGCNCNSWLGSTMIAFIFIFIYTNSQ